jgi:ubiquinone/menaquinone biosynthesis C-methylase UbiE
MRQSAKNMIKWVLPVSVKAALKKIIYDVNRSTESSEEYWTHTNVTGHHHFKSIEESLDYLDWRNRQYLGYIERMPVAGHDGKVVLDYGCGPGHDVVGIAHFSRPGKLIAMDVSATSLEEVRSRMSLHSLDAEFIHISENDERLPIDDGSVDVVHSSGVLHHTPSPESILREFARILRPGGYAQIMVYNYDSIFVHLYAAYHKMVLENTYPGSTLRQVFSRLTDGPNCPISECYHPVDFVAMCETAGFECEYQGAAISAFEMGLLASRFDALTDRRLAPESREFLYNLIIDERGCPLHDGDVAGVDACYLLKVKSG